jgi:AcrR family transcriptional regulator
MAPPKISKQGAVEAALRIIDADGLDALSMRKLAAALGINGPSLYHHFRNKNEILDAVVLLVLADLRPPEQDDNGDAADWIVEVASRYRRALRQHPNVVPLVLAGVNRRVGARVYDYGLGRLRRAGLTKAEARAVVDAVEAYVVGSVLLRQESAAVFKRTCRLLVTADLPAALASTAEQR